MMISYILVMVLATEPRLVFGMLTEHKTKEACEHAIKVLDLDPYQSVKLRCVAFAFESI